MPLTVYAIQLLLNFLWTPLFFKLHQLDLATFDILGKLTHLFGVSHFQLVELVGR